MAHVTGRFFMEVTLFDNQNLNAVRLQLHRRLRGMQLEAKVRSRLGLEQQTSECIRLLHMLEVQLNLEPFSEELVNVELPE